MNDKLYGFVNALQTKEERRMKYKAIRQKYPRSFAMRARDFNITTLKVKHGIEI